MKDRQPRELDLSRAWAEQRLPGELRLTDGRLVQVVYPGVWSNSDGPDFKGAMVSFDGRLERGAVELHLQASDWYRHRHNHDPAYDDVVLHVVLRNDLSETVRTSNNGQPPTLEVRDLITLDGQASDERATKLIASLGSRTCLPTTSKDRPDLVRAVLLERGWSRMVEKQLRFSQELQVLTAPEVLYRGLLDALGYSTNREGMAELGQRLPLQLLERFSAQGGYSKVAAALLGTGGLLPLAEAMTERVGARPQLLDRLWDQARTDYALEPLPASAWTLNRVRPQNHPAARLASLATLIAAPRQRPVFERLLSMDLDGGASWDRWLATARPAIGASRRRQIIVNILAPFLAAYAEATRDVEMIEEIAEDWERLPGGVSDRIARATKRQIAGDARFPIKLALEEQALHDIYRKGCSELRCFECPIATLAVEHEPWDGTSTG